MKYENLETLRNFNSHAHVERDFLIYTLWNVAADFNSHAHVERDPAVHSFLYLIFISTHTLTWSVTTGR